MPAPIKPALKFLNECHALNRDSVIDHEGDFQDAFQGLMEDAECIAQLRALLTVAVTKYHEPDMLHRYMYGPASALTKRMGEIGMEYLIRREERLAERATEMTDA